MKKIIFYIAIAVAIILLVNIIEILVTDLDRLTNYGYGYLAGKFLLFVVFIAIALVTRKPKKASNK
ncbi:hypothetical protein [Aequorivita echinoideorum]|uniref:Uncharacterized protein n=1 Tax=Aequorivita echinoideorum TaxID=1549647 RepID=A0ABS5S3L6_9FLAO|nr:hypothetical protein [Aequorivita echinoideorum]MBT0607783.1 hypothetical protein [Aequorivita echinoideorum]